MKHEVKVPSAGESVSEGYIGEWKKASGDQVKKGEVIVDLESQKATFELEAEVSGRLEILKSTQGEKVAVGEVIAFIDDAATEAQSPSPRPSPMKGEGVPAASPLAGEAARRAGEGVFQIGPAARRRGVTAPSATPAPAAPPQGAKPSPYTYTIDTSRGERTEKASRIRKYIAENLVAAQHTAAILTTFNEIDMTNVMALRKKYKEPLQKQHGVKIGMVGPFALAAARALQKYPIVNSTFTGEEIIKRDFVDLSIAVSTDRGLVVPVIRDMQKLDWIGFEKNLSEIAERARAGKLSIPEMTGGTFTITNGGAFGSLLATPLLNMPQTAILGLHKIEERPIALEGKVVIRPMMYVALSYDHRLIDGKEAVEFLVAIKEAIEDPSLIIDEGKLK